MIVYILRQINTEDKAYDATGVQAYSTSRSFGTWTSTTLDSGDIL